MLASRRPLRALPWAFPILGLATAASGFAAAPEPLFVERAADSGLDFVHFNGMSGEHYLLEITGAGAALLDYDNDGDLDAYLVQGHMLGPGKTIADATLAPRFAEPMTDRLYRNDLGVGADGRPQVRFVDVTEAIGLAATGYGMGVTAGDYDNDGWTDLYLTNYGSNQLLRNRGDGTFADMTAASGTDDPRWSVPASFFDYDGDGWLDLWVGNYVLFDFSLHTECPSSLGTAGYCGPLSYSPQPDSLFRNRGDGTFENVTVRAGLADEFGNALGSVVADFNGDRWLDLYVANDQVANLLWINRGDGTFRNEALLAGCAVNREGRPEASMGVDAADLDGDGDEDLFMGHLTSETNTLYLNDGRGLFSDETQLSGLGNASWDRTAFGTVWLDYDQDGWLDVVAVNGAVKIIAELAQQGDPLPLHQPNQLFRNLGDGRFAEVTEQAGPAFRLSEVSRGAAVGDVDNDGDPDLLVSNNGGSARLLINQVREPARWLGLRLVAGDGDRDLLGAWVGLTRRDGAALWRRVRTDGSFASARDPRLHFGLGTAAVERLDILWPDGGRRRVLGSPVDRYLTLAGPTRKAAP